VQHKNKVLRDGIVGNTGPSHFKYFAFKKLVAHYAFFF
jgi:hypothetical protein